MKALGCDLHFTGQRGQADDSLRGLRAIKDGAISYIKADKMINNGAMDVPTIVTEVVPVTKENLDATIIAEGFYTKEQVYGK